MVESTIEKDFQDLWKEEQQRVWTASAVSCVLCWTERGQSGPMGANVLFIRRKEMKREGETRTSMCPQSVLREKQKD